ncbi:hypothetical protein GXW78_12320 [Roseomonas terrae]|uniref:Uncharacterized protein n=1 Tax=Neoroseomonas terrae TaxID=424799 RepID=A0ABS5EHF2_9PROT|nr:hypothetical protein [Neoroseomonas terrae]MBR0650452.1 hypothetical protein [Neoroseomonas terrae]
MPLRAALGALRDVEQRHRHAQDRLLVVRREVADARAALAREEAAGPIDGNGRSVDVTVAAGDRLNAAEVEAARMSRITAALGEQAETARAALGPLIEVGRVGSIEWLDTELVAIDREYRAAADATMSIIARFVAVADQAGALHLTEAAIRLRLVRSLLDSGEGVMEIGSMLGMTPPVASPTSEQAADLRRLLDTARTAAAGSTSQHKEAA